MLKNEVRFDVVRRFVGIVWRSSVKYPLLSLGIISLILVSQSLLISVPFFLQRLVDAVANHPPSSYTLWGFIFVYVLPIAVVRVVGWLIWSGGGFVATELQPRVMKDLVEDGFHSIMIHSYRFFSDNFTGSLVRRVQSLATSYREIVETLWWTILPMIVSISLSTIFLSLRSPVLGLIVVAWVLLLFIANVLFSRFKLPYDKSRATKHAILTGTVSDAISNSTNISVFTARQEEELHLSEKAEDWRLASRAGWRIGETGAVFCFLINFACEVGIISFVVSQWLAGAATLGDIVFVQGVLMLMFNSTNGMGRSIRRLYEAAADSHEMMEIMDLKLEIRDARGAKSLSVKRGAIEFDHVNFSYHPEITILRDFSLAITAKEKVALVGTSGSGKTTVTKLLFRFFDIQDGSIKIDGQNIAKVTQDSLRQAIAYVPQEPILFHRSLMENIRYGRRDATDKEVIEAAKLAYCHEFIEASPEKYETLVGERGIKLSGGERQRISIARAILKDAPILVLDEATSSLDSESESFIQSALKRLMRDKTVIVIAHRLSTIMEMDRIIVMQEGKIVDEGTHDSLRAKVGIYQKLWNIQAGGFMEE